MKAFTLFNFSSCNWPYRYVFVFLFFSAPPNTTTEAPKEPTGLFYREIFANVCRFSSMLVILMSNTKDRV